MTGLSFSDDDRARLQELGVTAVYLMGSRAVGTATARSDYDFGIVLDRAARPADDQRYPALHAALYALLADCLPHEDAPPPGTLRDVDVVFLQRAPLYYTTHALKYGVLLYDGNPRARVQFEERAREAVMDFQPLRRELERALLATL